MLPFKETIQSVNISDLQKTLEAITGERHPEHSPEHHARTAHFIEQTLLGFGYSTERQHFDNGNVPGVNIIAEKRGLTLPEEILAITAHYDSVRNTPGCDDNGSGIAGLVECARLLRSFSFQRTVRFVAFDMEERQDNEQWLVGSEVYAAFCRERNENILGVLNLEMIGYTDGLPHTQTVPNGLENVAPDLVKKLGDQEFRADFLAVIGDQNSLKLQKAFLEAAAQFSPELKAFPIVAPASAQNVSDLFRSDHARFWELNYPALMLTDTANFRNPHYHGPGDGMHTLDFDFMAAVVKAVLATALQLLGSESESGGK